LAAKRLLLRVLLAATTASAAVTAWALDPHKSFEHYVRNAWSIADGLPQISAMSIAQGRDGYVWVGTQAGLARFDGVRFTTYTPESEPAIPGLFVRSLLTDRADRLWVGTYKGLAVYHDGRFATVPAADSARFPTLDVAALAARRNGEVIAATSDGLFRVASGRLHAIGGPAPAQGLLIEGDVMWVGTVGAVERLGNGRHDRMPLPAAAASATVNRIAMVAGVPWVGTSQGLFRRAGDAWVPVRAHPALEGIPVSAMLTDRSGNTWVASNAGLARFQGDALVEFVTDANPRSLPQVISMLEDREGNLWLGSQLAGIARFWNGWTRRYSEGAGLHDPIVWSVAPDPGGERLWVGTNDGLALLEDGRYTRVVPGSALPHPHAYNLLAEPDGVWIGTRSGLALWRDGRLQTPAWAEPLAAAQINGFARAPDGSLWITSGEGLFQLVQDRLRRFGEAEGLRDPRVRVLRFMGGDRLLLGTQDGLFELRGGRARALGLDAGLPAHQDVTAIDVLRDGRIVIGTLGDKSWIQAGGRWHPLGVAQGLPGNSPFFIAHDATTLWLVGIRGITRVPLAGLPTDATPRARIPGELVLNDRGDANAGQQGYCCNGAGMSKGLMRGGVIWAPSRDGLVALDTRAIVPNPLPPTMLIERLRTAHGWRPAPAPGTALALPAASRDVEIAFTALSFQDPRSVQLRYRLIGYDQRWQALDDNRLRSANYTNLPPGDYAFAVIGANNAGVWSKSPAILRFAIAPHFHETWLFRALLAALLASVVYGGYRYQGHRHARRQRMLETEVQARTAELNAANARLEEASQTDPLTGLRNRRYLASQIPADLAYYDREAGRSGDFGQLVVFALVDIDHFKRVNDTHGHRAGDQVLQQFAQVLGGLVRSGDYLARWGGEEFLLVFRPMDSRHVAMIGDRIRSAVAAHPFRIEGGGELRLTVSVGLAGYPMYNVDRQPGWEQMVDLADAALYWVKRHGRDGWARLEPAPGSDAAVLLHQLNDDVERLVASGRVRVMGSLRGEDPT
jgi:diguanylate cyclase (GGDEF)-like protein